MKSKLIVPALALTTLLGSAVVSSNGIDSNPSTVKLELSSIESNNEVTPHFWVAAGRVAAKGVAWGAGYLAGDKAARSVFGSSTQHEISYQYQEIKTSFDL